MRLLCRLLGHRWRWLPGVPVAACLRCPDLFYPQTIGAPRRPVLRPRYPSWWRSGERALWGAAAGSNVGVARGTALGENHQHSLNMQRMQGMKNRAPLDYD